MNGYERIGGGAALVLACLAMLGCGDDASGMRTQGVATGCMAGDTLACTCPDGRVSSQVCDPAGAVFQPCQCDAAMMPPAGPAGAGSAGMGATAQAGTGGMTAAGMAGAGMSGAAGTMAEAGAGGMAGMGMAGMGMAGASGSSAPAGDEVPDSEHCAEVAAWDPQWTQFEDEVLMLTNEARAAGATCGEYGSFGPAEPLTMNPELRCSARLHSLDMGERGYFAHDNPEGVGPGARMTAAGYAGRLMGENIAKGQQSPAEVVDGWMNSPGHCRNIMEAGYQDIGIGYWEGEAENQWFNGNKLWTQNFGASGGGGNCPWCR